MNDNQRGLYSKYHVTKDGKPLDGDCFVLRPDRDPAAVAALHAYAAATENSALAKDIIGWIGAPEPLTLDQLRERIGEPVWLCRTDWRGWDDSGWHFVDRAQDEIAAFTKCNHGVNVFYAKAQGTFAHHTPISDLAAYAHKPSGEGAHQPSSASANKISQLPDR